MTAQDMDKKDRLQEIFNEVSSWITPALERAFPEDLYDDITVKAAMYSLMAGGKRIRPAMMYMTAKMIRLDDDQLAVVRRFAQALELIHTYSLIHDDLPAMDNDDLRRGKPTCHKVYGEGIAVLAGDALMNRAYEILFALALKDQANTYPAYNIARLAGVLGMIGGQSIDIASEDKKISLDLLYELQKKKTGALIECAITTPYYIAGDKDDPVSLSLRRLAAHLGLMFQIKDDILDVTSSAEVLGKNCGKDERDDKATFVTLLGLDGAKSRLSEEYNGAIDVLADLAREGYDTSDYQALVDYLYVREN